MLEAARVLQAGPGRPKRSVLFVAVTAEERGLLGSRWFAERPTVARSRLAANINMDMYLPLFPLKALTILGIEESTLGAQATAAAEARGLGLVPDPQPDRNSFIRSDQYSFIRTGVPALALKFATPTGSQEAAIQKAWLTQRYHAPSDDLGQPVDRAAAARFNLYLADLIRRVADAPTRPRWKDDSFFKRFAVSEAP
jgi:Zn-dependent M28 family amino/carboxypeptidase